MLGSSTPVEYVTGIIADIPAMYAKATVEAYIKIWNVVIAILIEHWLMAIGILVGVLLFAILVYLTTGRWALLGSVLYHYLYFGILFLIGLINGPEVFVSDYFEAACAVMLYPLCYFTVRKILEATGIRTRY